MSLQGVECKNKSEPPGAGAGAVAKDARCEWPPGLAVEPQTSQKYQASPARTPSTLTKGPGSL